MVGTCNFFKKRLQYSCFLVIFVKFLKAPILQNICQHRILVDFLVTVYLAKKCLPWFLLNKYKKCVSLNEVSKTLGIKNHTLCEKCPNTEFFLVCIFLFRTEYDLCIQSKCRKIGTRKRSVFGHFSRSDTFKLKDVYT